MATEELIGPLYTQLKKYVKNKAVIEFKLLDGTNITGNILWIDKDALAVRLLDDTLMLIMRHGLISTKEIATNNA